MPDSYATISAEVSRPRPLVPASGRHSVTDAHTRPDRRSPVTRPLPDAACIYQVIIPQAPPPYDDAAPNPTPAPLARTARPLTLVTQPPAGTAQPTAQPPTGGTWPSRFAQVLAETLTGTRPPEQIAAWTTERARTRISQLGPAMATAHRPRVRRILAASPTSGVLEMTIIVGLGPRVRALAVRLERADQPSPGAHGQPGHAQDVGPWRCTAVDAA